MSNIVPAENIRRVLEALPDEEYVAMLNEFYTKHRQKSLILKNTAENMNKLITAAGEEYIQELMNIGLEYGHYREGDKWLRVGGGLITANDPRDLGKLNNNSLDAILIALFYEEGKLCDTYKAKLDKLLLSMH